MQIVLAIVVCMEKSPTNPGSYLTNLRRMCAADGLPSGPPPLLVAATTAGHSVAGYADAAFQGCGRPTNTKLLHPVGQRRSLHP